MRIDPAQHPWMTAPETAQLMAALPQARFVGGAVRNALLGVPVADIDIAVPMLPQDVLALLRDRGIRVIETGIAHGTVTAVVNGHVFEVTSLRRDVETDGRRAVIAFTDDWAEDVMRRDFTMNALYATADGEIFDYATGVEDLQAGRVRFMGDAATRIAEDYLRVLRLFRFHAWYGRGDIDAVALRACAAARDKLKTLSAERVAKELLRLLEAATPAPVLRVMAATAILPELLPGALQLPRLERMTRIDLDNGFAPDGVLRLAALLPDTVQAARDCADALRLSNADRARLEQALGAPHLAPALSAKQARLLLYRLGTLCFQDKVRLGWAGMPRQDGEALRWRMMLRLAETWERPRFALTGRDVMAAGVKEGPDIGRVLARIEDWWASGDFTASEAELRAKLKSMVDDAGVAG